MDMHAVGWTTCRRLEEQVDPEATKCIGQGGAKPLRGKVRL